MILGVEVVGEWMLRAYRIIKQSIIIHRFGPRFKAYSTIVWSQNVPNMRKSPTKLWCLRGGFEYIMGDGISSDL